MTHKPIIEGGMSRPSAGAIPIERTLLRTPERSMRIPLWWAAAILVFGLGAEALAGCAVWL